MKLERILPFARALLQTSTTEGDTVIDATAGNGHDTAFLAQLVGESGHVVAFDIQEAAIQATKERLEKGELLSRATLVHGSHGDVLNYVTKPVAAAIFNLGYLPGGDKSIVTLPESTLAAIQGILQLLKTEGVCILVVYHGHPEGVEEKHAVIEFATSLPQEEFHVAQYGFINQRNAPPFIIAIEKR